MSGSRKMRSCRISGVKVTYEPDCEYAGGEDELDMRLYDSFGMMHAIQFVGDDLTKLLAFVKRVRRKR
jgi:hypothetical protein